MRIIRASEIGEYVYCHRAWWLRHVRGLQSANVQVMADGTATHAAHGRLVWLTTALRVIAIAAIVLALLLWLLSSLHFS